MKLDKGQTMVEYILLLAVVAFLVMSLYNSAAFKKLFGQQGSLGKTIKKESEFAYRHAFAGSPSIPNYPVTRDASAHPSYHDPGEGGSRFFGPQEKYPSQ